MDANTVACILRAGDLSATFLPNAGMLGASFQHRGDELLGRVEDIASFAASGRTCGIPFLYPWANRLSSTQFRAAGKEISLDTASPLLHFDKTLPMHGVPWSQLAWQVLDARAASVHARLDWTRAELLAVFPFPHHVEMNVMLKENMLAVETKIVADALSAVPISFGFHPYFKIPGAPRNEWHAQFPTMTHLELDAQQIPNGQTTPFDAFDAGLGERAFDDGFALANEHAQFAIQDRVRRIRIEFLEGYPYAQIYAPSDKDYIAIEPMTAPTNALVTRDALRVVNAGEIFRAVFRIHVETI